MCLDGDPLGGSEDEQERKDGKDDGRVPARFDGRADEPEKGGGVAVDEAACVAEPDLSAVTPLLAPQPSLMFQPVFLIGGGIVVEPGPILFDVLFRGTFEILRPRHEIRVELVGSSGSAHAPTPSKRGQKRFLTACR